MTRGRGSEASRKLVGNSLAIVPDGGLTEHKVVLDVQRRCGMGIRKEAVGRRRWIRQRRSRGGGFRGQALIRGVRAAVAFLSIVLNELINLRGYPVRRQQSEKLRT